MKDRDHNEAMSELFKQDPEFAVAYLNDVLDNGGFAELMVALRQIAQAENISQPVESFISCFQTENAYSKTQDDTNDFTKFSFQKLNNALKHLNLHLSISRFRPEAY